MILHFNGGVRPEERTRFGKNKIKTVASANMVCIKADKNPRSYIEPESKVKKGSIIGENDGTPIFASVAGTYKGIVKFEDEPFFAITNNGENEEEIPFSPENRTIFELNDASIIESARKFGIIDVRSGIPLWKMLSRVNDCRRIVVDCTETDALSAINYRLCIEKAKSIIGGAKVLLKATGALKCIFAAEYNRKSAFKSLLEFATDEKLFAMAELDEKYPYGDNALMTAIYINPLSEGESPLDKGVFIVGVETVVALYDAMISGKPFVERYVSLCGEGIENGGNFKVPRGITIRDLSDLLGKRKNGFILVENSLLSGSIAKSALPDNVSAVISVYPSSKKRTDCISCGRCVDACPVGIIPSDVLFDDPRKLCEICNSCGACEFVCPSGIPLLSLIKRGKIKSGADFASPSEDFR